MEGKCGGVAEERIRTHLDANIGNISIRMMKNTLKTRITEDSQWLSRRDVL